MRLTFKTAVFIGIVTLSGFAASTREAAAQQLQAYYYRSPGYYATTAGTVYIPAAGYYYNVPAVTSVYAAAPRYTSRYPSYVYQPAYATRRGGGGPNNPPYYSGANHSLHGRGFDSGSHGR